MNVYNLAQKLGYEILSLPDGERIAENAYTGDLLSWVMGRAQSGCIWVTIMTNPNICAVAVLVDAACVIIADNAEIAPETLVLANAKGVNILRSSDSAFDICVKLGSEIFEQ